MRCSENGLYFLTLSQIEKPRHIQNEVSLLVTTNNHSLLVKVGEAPYKMTPLKQNRVHPLRHQISQICL